MCGSRVPCYSMPIEIKRDEHNPRRRTVSLFRGSDFHRSGVPAALMMINASHYLFHRFREQFVDNEECMASFVEACHSERIIAIP